MMTSERWYIERMVKMIRTLPWNILLSGMKRKLNYFVYISLNIIFAYNTAYNSLISKLSETIEVRNRLCFWNIIYLSLFMYIWSFSIHYNDWGFFFFCLAVEICKIWVKKKTVFEEWEMSQGLVRNGSSEGKRTTLMMILQAMIQIHIQLTNRIFITQIPFLTLIS